MTFRILLLVEVVLPQMLMRFAYRQQDSWQPDTAGSRVSVNHHLPFATALILVGTNHDSKISNPSKLYVIYA